MTAKLYLTEITFEYADVTEVGGSPRRNLARINVEYTVARGNVEMSGKLTIQPHDHEAQRDVRVHTLEKVRELFNGTVEVVS